MDLLLTRHPLPRVSCFSFLLSLSLPRSLRQPPLARPENEKGGGHLEMTIFLFSFFTPVIRPNARRRYNGKTKYEMMIIAVWWLLELTHDFFYMNKDSRTFINLWMVDRNHFRAKKYKVNMRLEAFLLTYIQWVHKTNFCSFQGLIVQTVKSNIFNILLKTTWMATSPVSWWMASMINELFES